jgi:outer membrane receptor protein involved in Fe transport
VAIHELGGWSASLYTRYFGPRPLVEDGSVRSTASTLFNGQASYRITGWARLTLDVFNLFDAQVDDIAYFYRSRLRGEPIQGPSPPGPPGARGVDDVHFHPAEKRSVRLTAALKF